MDPEKQLEALSAEEPKRIEPITEAQPKAEESPARLTPEAQELSNLKATRDGRTYEPELIDGEENPKFVPFRDCDRPLAAGTVVQIAGVDVRLLSDVAAMAPEFRDEAVFAEHLAETGNAKSFAVNAVHMRNRYNGSGANIGVNEDHPLSKLDARIAELELIVAAQAAAEIEKAKQEEAATSLPAEPIKG